MITIDVTDDVRDFIRSISNPKLRAKIFRGFELLAGNWPRIGEPHVKAIEGRKGLWELREQSGNYRVRLFFYQDSPQTLVMVHGIVKKSRKIPQKELATAERKMKEYQARRGK